MEPQGFLLRVRAWTGFSPPASPPSLAAVATKGALVTFSALRQPLRQPPSALFGIVHVDMAEPSHGSRIQKNPLARVCRRFVMSKRCATVQINDKFLFMTSRVRLVLRLVPSAHCKGLPPE